ncbi:MAG: aminotransferase class V-fold PLP-dependent enzyme [Planctomycetes bacterium]|nr:aminotransferase class V-fold PLP-dependent enzyme [Planctomycetota bacterium]
MPGPRPIYLDHAATTRPLPRVVEAVADAQERLFGNPSSAHALGGAARAALEDAREYLRGTLGAARVVFTSGGSEADALGIVGGAAARPPGRVLMAQSDHAAILRTEGLLSRFRHHTTALPVTEHGDLDPEVLFGALGSDVRAVALMHGHNELGTLSRLADLVELVRRAAPEAHVHVDLVQTYGKLPVTFDDCDVDSVAVSGHKFHGPRGIGFLALSSTARLLALQPAGGQEEGLRGGTENLPGAIGMQVAAEHVLSHQAATAVHTAALAERMFAAVREVLPEARRLGHPERRLPHILSLHLPGVVGQTLQLRCSARSVLFATGAACHGTPGESGGEPAKAPTNHVLAAIGLDRHAVREVVRLSFAAETTAAEADQAAAVLTEEITRLLQQAPRRRHDGKVRS